MSVFGDKKKFKTILKLVCTLYKHIKQKTQTKHSLLVNSVQSLYYFIRFRTFSWNAFRNSIPNSQLYKLTTYSIDYNENKKKNFVYASESFDLHSKLVRIHIEISKITVSSAELLQTQSSSQMFKIWILCSGKWNVKQFDFIAKYRILKIVTVFYFR